MFECIKNMNHEKVYVSAEPRYDLPKEFTDEDIECITSSNPFTTIHFYESLAYRHHFGTKRKIYRLWYCRNNTLFEIVNIENNKEFNFKYVKKEGNIGKYISAIINNLKEPDCDEIFGSLEARLPIVYETH